MTTIALLRLVIAFLILEEDEPIYRARGGRRLRSTMLRLK